MKGLEEESKSFDLRIKERVKHGHIPDLRRTKFCSWFYNNPWRHPKYVSWIFGEYLNFTLKNLKDYNAKDVLEVGCGPGHISLELARNGFNVTGIDISKEAIKVANKLKKENPFKKNFGNLVYLRKSFQDFKAEKKFDAICFLLSLHHFEDLDKILLKVKKLLRKNGRIIVVEPAVDWFSEKNAFFVGALRVLLSYFNAWYENLNLPENEEDFLKINNEILTEFREWREKNESKQSSMDNVVKGKEMLSSLRKYFKQIEFKYGYSFIPRMLGGIRGKDEESTIKLANFIRIMDLISVEKGFLDPSSFYFSGEKEEEL